MGEPVAGAAAEGRQSLIHQRRLPGRPYRAEELGPACFQPAEEVLAALAMPSRGAIYDLDAGRWPGMPVLPVHPPFVLTTYRTPGRSQVDADLPRTTTGFITELVTSSTHTGTHIDALSHITHAGEWFGGGSAATDIGDFGPISAEASSIPPIVCRGILVDVARLKGVDRLPAGHPITRDELAAALEAQGTILRSGDAVLVRTGYMAAWGRDEEIRRSHYGAGLTLDAGAWLADRGATVVGADTEDLEQVPSPDPSRPLPVHVELLVERGIYIIELLHLEDLARDGIYEFLFICLPLRIRGATGSMVRPVALV